MQSGKANQRYLSDSARAYFLRRNRREERCALAVRQHSRSIAARTCEELRQDKTAARKLFPHSVMEELHNLQPEDIVEPFRACRFAALIGAEKEKRQRDQQVLNARRGFVQRRRNMIRARQRIRIRTSRMLVNQAPSSVCASLEADRMTIVRLDKVRYTRDEIHAIRKEMIKESSLPTLTCNYTKCPGVLDSIVGVSRNFGVAETPRELRYVPDCAAGRNQKVEENFPCLTSVQVRHIDELLRMNADERTFELTRLGDLTGAGTESTFFAPKPKLFVGPEVDPSLEVLLGSQISGGTEKKNGAGRGTRSRKRFEKRFLPDPFFPVEPPRFVSELYDEEPEVEVYVQPRSQDVLVGCADVDQNCSRHRIKRPPEPHAREGVLAPIVSSSLDYEAIKMMDIDGELLENEGCILDVLQYEDAFRRVFLQGESLPERRPTRISRHMMHHLPRMELFDICRKTKDPLALMPLFCVAKKSGQLRLILDCRWLNEIGAAPPPMHLPTIHEILLYLLSNEWAAQVDAASWFYQFGLPGEIRRYFGARLAGHRGQELCDVTLTKMLWAPALGQRVSNVLVRGIGMTWVDNTLLAALTRQELEENIEELKRRFAKANAKADYSTLVPTQKIEALGMEIDLASKQFRMAPSWVSSIDTTPVPSTMTLRQLYQYLGKYLWAAHVRQVPLCDFPYVLETMSMAVKGPEFEKNGWDGSVTLFERQIIDLRKLQTLILKNEWCRLKTAPKEETCRYEVWSDASDEVSAYIVIDRIMGKVIWAEQWGTDALTHIFVKELNTAVTALKWCRNNVDYAGGVATRIDNAAAHHCVRKGHSTVVRANEMLRTVSDVPRATRLIGTDDMIADMFTRGVNTRTYVGCPTDQLRTDFAEWKKDRQRKQAEVAHMKSFAPGGSSLQAKLDKRGCF